MNLYWLYDIPTWALFILIIGLVCTIAVAGCLILRQKFDRWLSLTEETNELVGHFLSFTGVFYGIILGLVAVGAWETYNDAGARVDTEAARLAALYRDVTQLPEPYRGDLQLQVRMYTSAVIDKEWAHQRVGEPPAEGDRPMSSIGAKLFAVPITTKNVEVTVTEAARQFNSLVEARRARIQSVGAAIPGSLWYVLVVGTMIIIVMTWMLNIANKRLDVAINLLMGSLMGTVLAFIIAMDNPYRGELSVSSAPYQLIYDRLMEGALRSNARP
jgi:Protein of unknown function (DUF4239)